MGNPRPSGWLALALLAAAFTTGCGQHGEAHDAAAITEQFHAALERHDGKAACGMLSSQTSSKLEQQAKKPCEQAVLEVGLQAGGPAIDTDVYVTSASVTLSHGDTTILDRGPNGWEISATGCKPSQPDQPYDCDLED